MGDVTIGMLGVQQDMFMKLLIAQLQNQNPMDPMSNAEMVSQMAQLAALDGVNSLNVSFADVLKLQRLLSGTQLLGREVEYLEDNVPMRGTVESVSTRGGTIKLVVDGQEISLDDITKVL